MNKYTKNTDVVILCGGKGTRLGALTEKIPKILIPIKGKPFLEVLLERLSAEGYKRFVLCVGHLGKEIANYVKNKRHKGRHDIDILISSEEEAMGTGGAVKNAESLIQSDPFIVMNGDMIFDMKLCALEDFHISLKSSLSIVITHDPERKDSGNVLVDQNNKIISFAERNSKEGGFMSAGIYVMNKSLLKNMDHVPFSLEYDFFPVVIKRVACFGFMKPGLFIDIGTPDRYRKANEIN
ncbi:MAG: hypothetical protein A3A04_00625 [Candidatus Harrisonbacteria bacterium RIFCSPLOWO2_01_FULL_40_28]|uniref:Nucleotidyl transferase domain-containing protein n=2 Tax=Candidatus Harrisoniibacteriota TaxID=1817905 RepID=A0A1G1ZVD5_9BACT|nr:MAG: hypothetical protein A3A04_00625 [Candidatus Harrisonbacteria bacterium RIFCSPLOWO2_01_FULL_40_28]OGY68439.1 MAG: hypothetical protein A2586_01040 [Candidatus Harrisonbacteria bacterium RIFOXYD1_FULL_40_9]